MRLVDLVDFVKLYLYIYICTTIDKQRQQEKTRDNHHFDIGLNVDADITGTRTAPYWFHTLSIIAADATRVDLSYAVTVRASLLFTRMFSHIGIFVVFLTSFAVKESTGVAYFATNRKPP